MTIKLCFVLFIVGAVAVLSLLGDTFSIFPVFLICLLICNYVAVKFYKEIRFLAVGSYLFYSISGTIAYTTYLFYCGNTFAPYHDDSYYFLNIQNFIQTFSITKKTGYEIFLALIAYPFSFLFEIKHVQLLPINWLLGSLVVSEAVKFANKVVPVNGKKNLYIGGCFILLNSSFIDGVIHLYRDPLMCFLLIKSFSNIYDSKLLKGFVYSVFTASIRTANGFIAILYLFIVKLTLIFGLKKRGIIFFSLSFAILFLLSVNFINLKYLRSFYDDEDIKIAVSERIIQFRNEENSDGGVMSLLRSNNPLLKALAVPFYMVSPLKVRNFNVVEDYNERDHETRQIVRFRINSIWECLSVSFYSFYLCYLFMGLYYWASDINPKNAALFIIFVMMLLSVTYISMQARHKMMFIMFFPILFNYCKSRIPVKKYHILNIASFSALFFIALYNFL